MTLHGNVLNSEEAGELAAIIDRDAISTGDRNHEWLELNECNAERCPVCKADYASIADRSWLLELHRRLAARVAELEAELAGTPPTLEWLRRQFGSQPAVVLLSTGYESYRWSCGIKYYPAHNRVSGPTGLTLTTRAAVLAAVAAAKEQA